MDVSTESNNVHRSTCPYISTKVMGVHGVTTTDNSTVNTVVCGITNTYDEYGRLETKYYICTDILDKEQNGISYSRDL